MFAANDNGSSPRFTPVGIWALRDVMDTIVLNAGNDNVPRRLPAILKALDEVRSAPRPASGVQ